MLKLVRKDGTNYTFLVVPDHTQSTGLRRRYITNPAVIAQNQALGLWPRTIEVWSAAALEAVRQGNPIV